MKLELVNEIIECLGGERRLFCFYPGCHWVNTLVNAMQQRALSTVKCGELNTLCGTNVRDKPVIKSALKHFASGKLSITDLACLTPAETQIFNLSLAAWGDGSRGWDQTSRNQSNWGTSDQPQPLFGFQAFLSSRHFIEAYWLSVEIK